MTKIHHLNCGTMCPNSRRFINGEGGWLENAEMVCHVLLIEGGDGLTLVDTGLGTGDCENPKQLGRPFGFMVRPKLRREETALERVRALGFDPADVRHLILTHCDLDHAGGLPDFPGAQVHLFKVEDEARRNPSLREKPRYIKAHFAHGPKWEIHDVGGEEWKGFESVQVLPGAPEVLMIPLPGHTRGHTAVAVQREGDWLLHCGDAYFHRGEMQTPPKGSTGLKVFQELTNVNGKLRKANQERLRELVRDHGSEVKTICSHDRVELAQSQA